MLYSGTFFKLVSSDSLVDAIPYAEFESNGYSEEVAGKDELDFALVRLDGAPGAQPVGGAKGDDDSRRGYIHVPAEVSDPKPGGAVLIMQHPASEPLSFSIKTESGVSLNSNGTRLCYLTETLPGSSGSQCFSLEWELLALHHYGDRNFKGFHDEGYFQGVPIAKIIEHSKTKGLHDLLGDNSA
jgi:hypothetical protein